MTAPAKPTVQVPVIGAQEAALAQQPSSDPTARKVAEILLAGYAAAKTAKLIAALLGVPRKAVVAALGLATTAHSARAQLKPHGIVANSPAYELVKAVRNADVYYRAAYIAVASKRLAERTAQGASWREAVGAEKPNFDAHARARRNRMDAAAKTAVAAQAFGPLLGWYLDPLLDNDPDCLAADGHNFYAALGTIIGLPGSVHPNCGCRAGPPHAGATMVDKAVTSVLEPHAAVLPRALHRRRRAA